MTAVPPPPAVTPPAPRADRDTAPFWDGVARGELVIQRCEDCHELRHPPGPMCPACRSLRWDTVTASGRGTIFSAIVPRYPELPGFEYPYVVVLVALEEGPRLVANLRGAPPGDARIGAPVELFLEDHDGFRLPQFRLVPEGSS
ncbi:MAG TPA: OB-fold domain-containing protein [Acidimicrobiales bacterium]|nr:OB-fold domain-containing protein [Acidimicrobiales bacterium]